MYLHFVLHDSFCLYCERVEGANTPQVVSQPWALGDVKHGHPIKYFMFNNFASVRWLLFALQYSVCLICVTSQYCR